MADSATLMSTSGHQASIFHPLFDMRLIKSKNGEIRIEMKLFKIVMIKSLLVRNAGHGGCGIPTSHVQGRT